VNDGFTNDGSGVELMYVGQIPGFAMDVDLDGIALAPMRDSLSAWLTEVGVHEEPRRAVVLAAHEAAATAVMHATAPQVIHVSTTLLDEHVLVEVANRPTDLVVADLPAPALDRERTFALLSSLVEHAEIETTSSGLTIRLWESLSRRV
jgi:hypothetical protein